MTFPTGPEGSPPLFAPGPLQEQAERVRSSDVLGRSGQLRRLFDYFVERSLAERAPKEIEIAVDVFGKGAAFEMAQDAVVRVYIHKLRKKLDEYYSGPGRDESVRLTIPKGEYRLVVVPYRKDGNEGAHSDAIIDKPPVAAPARNWPRWPVVAFAAVLILNLTAWWVWLRPLPLPDSELIAARASVLWSGVLDDALPVYIAVGDYYIFGELDDSAIAVRRLVREYNINSSNDLETYLKNNPTMVDRYMDVGLQYLPTSTAFALQNVLQLLGSKNTRQVRIVLASELTPSMLKSAHIVYIGLLSGMGILRELTFSASRFSIGDTFDELVDRDDNQHYVSQAASTVGRHTQYRDYGFFSTFSGPIGNRILIIAGTRDVAVMHTAEAVTHAAGLKELAQHSGTVKNFEALYSVEAIDRMNLNGRLLRTDEIDAERILQGNQSP